MNDVDYVKAILTTQFQTERPDEIPYPALDEVIRAASFEYMEGKVDGETANGSKSREGHDYFWFKHGDKSILSHRFIVAVTLGKWAPRAFDVDHINHNPSDNRPSNLRVVTSRDNANNRRKALLSELADLNAIALELKNRKLTESVSAAPIPRTVAPSHDISFGGPIPHITFTGETKPAGNGGTWHKTNQGSWHLKFD